MAFGKIITHQELYRNWKLINEHMALKHNVTPHIRGIYVQIHSVHTLGVTNMHE